MPDAAGISRTASTSRAIIATLTDAIAAAGLEDPYGLPHRALALLLLEKDPEFIELTSAMPGWQPVLELAAELRQQIEDEHGQSAATRIAGERHALAGIITDEVETSRPRPEARLGRAALALYHQPDHRRADPLAGAGDDLSAHVFRGQQPGGPASAMSGSTYVAAPSSSPLLYR